MYWASTQNKHGAPGICTSSGDPLFKIYRATGDRRYAELMRDIVHAWQEGVKPGGGISERLTYCDADSRGNRGGGDGDNGWCELNGILMAMELPGIYLRTDRDEMYVFDSVEAQVVKRDLDRRDAPDHQSHQVRCPGDSPNRKRGASATPPRHHRIPQVAEGRNQGGCDHPNHPQIGKLFK